MAVTLNNAAKNQIMRVLREEGYPSYAKLLDLFDIYLTDDPEVIGYMVPDKAKIVLNKDLSINQVSVVVRHEMLHEYFTHHARAQKFNKDHEDLLPDHDSANIAADFEISNRGYTDRDKTTIRSIVLNDKLLRGLVTEDQYPGWENKTFEEMYEEILKKRKQDKEQIKKLMDQIQKLTKKDLEDLEKEIENQQQQNQSQNQGQPQSNGSSQKAANEEDEENSTGSGSGKPSDEKDEDAAKSQAADEAKKALDDVKKDLDKIQQGKKSGKDGASGPFDTTEEQAKKDELARRVAEIKEYISDSGKMGDLLSDSNQAKQREKAAKAARDAERKNADPLNMFKLNLNRFIADQLSEIQEETPARINPAYEDSEFILPGMMWKENKYVPKINVYHDVSGSFSDPAKTEMAMRAIDTLNKYVRDGDLIIDVYYFADRVSSTKRGAGGGTSGTPILEHVKQTKPTNVIVITDGDISDCREEVKVPGAVWMLFYGSRSENIMQHLRGKKQNKYYDITWK